VRLGGWCSYGRAGAARGRLFGGWTRPHRRPHRGYHLRFLFVLAMGIGLRSATRAEHHHRHRIVTFPLCARARARPTSAAIRFVQAARLSATVSVRIYCVYPPTQAVMIVQMSLTMGLTPSSTAGGPFLHRPRVRPCPATDALTWGIMLARKGAGFMVFQGSGGLRCFRPRAEIAVFCCHFCFATVLRDKIVDPQRRT